MWQWLGDGCIDGSGDGCGDGCGDGSGDGCGDGSGDGCGDGRGDDLDIKDLTAKVGAAVVIIDK